ncbi:MAG: alpha/beta hydrolase [Pseudomonadota bacterium]
MPDRPTQSPAFPLPFLEPFRAFWELSSVPAGAAILSFAPDGDGHPVLTLPGFLGGDGSMSVIRRYLRSKNYDPHPWLLGRNEGPHTSGEGGVLVDQRINELYEASGGRKVSLVGWSLGGIMARNAARRIPDKVRQVITLGSPFNSRERTSSISFLFKAVSGRDPNSEEFRTVLDYNRPPPPVEIPTTAIFTKTDGVVHWSTCLEEDHPHTENIEVQASHLGLAVNPLVHYLVAERLAHEEGEWMPFDRKASAWRRVAFPSTGFHH